MNIKRLTFTSGNTKRNNIINPKTTGYAAVAGIGMSMVSGMVKQETLNKSHKYFAGFSIASIIAHIYLLNGYKKSK